MLKLTDLGAQDRLMLPGPVMVTLGSSITAQGVSSSATQKAYLALGWQNWLQRLSGQQFYYPIANNLAVGGYTTADVLSTVPAALALNPDIVFIDGGCLRNDITGLSLAVEASIANLTEIIKRLVQRGIAVVVLTIEPDNTMTATQEKKRNRLNRWLLELGAGRADRIAAAHFPAGRLPLVVDINRYIVDQTTGGYITGYDLDGVHPGLTGAYWMGRAVWNAIGSALPPRHSSWVAYDDLYDATYNPAGNLLANGILAGTAGTKTSGGTFTASGNVADSWTFRRSGTPTSTMAGVAAKESPRTDGPNSGERQSLTFTCSGAGGTNEVYILTQTISSNIAAGDRVVAEIAYEFVSGTKVQSIYTQLSEGGPGSPQIAYDGIPGGTLTGFPAVAHKGVIRTPEIVLQSGTTSLTYSLLMAFDTSAATAALALKASDAKVYKLI